jgi:hypothetical protein
VPPLRRMAAIVLATLSILAIAAPVAAKPGSGNSTGSAACENGGYVSWTRQDGSTFKNEGECAKYTAKGGVLVPAQTVSVQWFASSTPGRVQFAFSWSGYTASTSFNTDLRYGTLSISSAGNTPNAASGTYTPPDDFACQNTSGSVITALVVQKGTAFSSGGGSGWFPDGSAPVSLPGPDATLCPPPG